MLNVTKPLLNTQADPQTQAQLKPVHSAYDFPAPPTVILAAGRGNRLLPLTYQRPKCLVEIGGAPLLTHQIRALCAAGVRQIEVITGHGAALVEEACAPLIETASAPGATPASDSTAPFTLTFTHNVHHSTTGSLASFGALTAQPGPAGLLVLNGDVLFHPDLLRRLVDDPREELLLADYAARLGEEEVKVCVDTNWRVTAIGKALDPTLAQAEYLGILKLGRFAALQLLELARDPRAHAEGIIHLADAIHALRDEIDFHAISSHGAPWIEIDYHHDLKRAREKVWPQLAGADGARDKSF